MRGPVPTYLAPHVERVEDYMREWMLDNFLLVTGQRAETDRTIHERYRDLNDGRLLREAIEHGHYSYARALANPYFAASLVDAGDRLRAARRELTTTFGKETVRIPQLTERWMSAGGPDRDELARAAMALLERRSTAEREWVEAHATAVRALGFDRHVDLITTLHGDVGPWLRHARRWLDETRGPFLASWRDWRRRDGIEGSPFNPNLGRSPTAPKAARDLVTAVRDSVTAWGFGEVAARIPIDVEPRPGKSALSMCGRIAPPSDVRVTTSASDQLVAYAVLLHEFGHALHFALGADRPFDLFGDYQGITEAFGMTFQWAATQPAWFSKFGGVALDEESIERLHFLMELLRRLDAIHVLYEFAVHSGDVEPTTEFVRLYASELDVAITPHLAYWRMQLFLEHRPFYPLYLHQANSMRDAIRDELVQQGGAQWFLNDRSRSHLVARFRLTCEVDLPEWMNVLGIVLA
jgi:hypothetical protein